LTAVASEGLHRGNTAAKEEGMPKPVQSHLTSGSRWQIARQWTEFQNDPAWHRARDDSERDGPIVANISNQILAPTAFSALK
jgi:hypothetical protein